MSAWRLSSKGSLCLANGGASIYVSNTRELERDGLVSRTYYPTIPPKVEYSLTPTGESFQEPVRALGQWALDNLGVIDNAREKYDVAAAEKSQ